MSGKENIPRFPHKDFLNPHRRLYFKPQINIHQYIISYGFADDDTLKMDLSITFPTDCCPALVEGYTVTINGEVQSDNSEDRVFVLKKQ